MEIIRKNELQEILDLVKMMSHGKIFVTGAAGSGKTFLLNIAGKILWEQGKKIRYKIWNFSRTIRRQGIICRNQVTLFI